jgi:hypothetical protein
MSVAKRLEIRTIIKFCANIGKTPTDTYKELKRASGTSSVSRRLVFKWHKRSVESRETVDDENRSDRHPSVMPVHVKRVVQYIRALVYCIRTIKTTKCFASIIPLLTVKQSIT